MKNIKFLILGLCLFPLITFAQFQPKSKKSSDLNAPISVDKKVRVGKLDNGLTYYIRVNKKPEKRAQFQLAVNAGSILEDDDQLGLAHFTEHMAFNGTKYFKGNEMINILQKNGITFGSHVNAYTFFDETVYNVDVPTNNEESIELGFKVLDGWAFGMLMDVKEIDKERGVIIEERRTGLGASERLSNAILPIMLKDSRYAKRLPIGTLEVLQSFKYETIRRFYKDWYRPDLTAIILVGDFDADKMEAKIKQYFGNYPKHENPRERKYYDIPNNKEPLIAIATDKEATGISLSFFWKHPHVKESTIGDYKTGLTYRLFTGMLNSRLNELGQKPDCPFIFAQTSYGNFLSHSSDVFSADCYPKENQIDESLQMILREIYRVKQHGFLNTEFERQKEDILSSYEKAAKEADKTQSTTLAGEYVNNYLKQEPIPGIETELKYVTEFLGDIQLEEVNALVTKWITDENFVLALTAPKKEDLLIPTEKTIISILDAAKKETLSAYVDNFKEEPLIKETLTGGKIINTKSNAEFGYTEYTLNNGIRVIVKATDFKNDEILINAFSPGGSSLYDDNLYFNASMAANIIGGSGIGDFDKTQLTKKLKGKNIALSPNIGELTQGFSGSCSPKDFETALQLIYLFFKEPRKDQEAFDKYVSQLKNQLRFINASPEAAFYKELQKATYPDSKRMIVIPSEEDLNSLNLEQAYRIYTERFGPNSGNFTFLFVGNIDSDSTLRMIEKYLGSLPSSNKKEVWINRSSPFAKGIVNKEVIKGTEDKATLAIIECKMFDDYDNTKERTIVSVLSEALQISITEEIREKMGSAYSPHIELDIEKYPNSEISLSMIIQCKPDRVDKITKAVLNLLKKYQKKGTDKETLEKVKKQLISKRETAMKQNNTWVGMLYVYYWENISLRSFEKYSEDVNAITNDDIKAFAKKYLSVEEYVRVTLKPEKKVTEKEK